MTPEKAALLERLEAERCTLCPEPPKGCNNDGPTALLMAAEAMSAPRALRAVS